MDETSEGLAPHEVLVEQSARLVFEIADDIVILNSGEVAFRGAAGDIRSDDALVVQYPGVFLKVKREFNDRRLEQV